MPTPQGVAVLALVADMIFASRIRGAGEAVGTPTATVSSPAKLLERCREERPALVLVDLDARRGAGVDAVRSLKEDPGTRGIPLVAFASHVNAEAIAGARAAGADRVLARSSFVRELPGLLEAAAQEPGTAP